MKNPKSVFVTLLILPLFLSSTVVFASPVVWSRMHEIGSFPPQANSITETSDGGYAIAGVFGTDFWLVKIDELGNIQWDRIYGGEENDQALSVVETSDGGYALAGVTTSFGVGGVDDFWLVKTDEDGVAPVEPEAPWVVLRGTIRAIPHD